MSITFEDSLDTDALTKKYQAKDLGPIKVLKVGGCNFKPHPFTIGPKHVVDAADNYGGRLGLETIRRIPCAAPYCQLHADKHYQDIVLFLQLTRDVTNKEVNDVLQPIGKEMEEDRIDGLVFVETPEAYRATA